MGCIPVITSLMDLRILGGVAVWLVLGSLLVSCLKPPVTSEQRYDNSSVYYVPNFENVGSILVSACPCVRLFNCFKAMILKFHIWIPYQEIANPYVFLV